MKKLIKNFMIILIGLSLNSCFLGEDLTDEYYNPILRNGTNKKITLKLIHNTEKGVSKLVDNIYISAKTDTIYWRFYGNNLKSNIEQDIDNDFGSKIEIYMDGELVKTWNGPHGDYGELNSPYNYNSWKETIYQKPIITAENDRVLGTYIFTITNEDIDIK